ncbi:MAG: hypothetical protein PHW76_03785 [Alphaproteobacteria bacterium]|nr:hypothetical protein [Alphaproteobacteria bacterium]
MSIKWDADAARYVLRFRVPADAEDTLNDLDFISWLQSKFKAEYENATSSCSTVENQSCTFLQFELRFSGLKEMHEAERLCFDRLTKAGNIDPDYFPEVHKADPLRIRATDLFDLAMGAKKPG